MGKRQLSIALVVRQNGLHQNGVGLVARLRPNPSIERTCPGKPGHASHLKR